MACCYIAASMIAFIIRSCDALDINLHLQYNESVDHAYEEDLEDGQTAEKPATRDEAGITIVSISGMTCGACTATVESALLKVDGVHQALVTLPVQEARVFHDAELNKDSLISAIEKVGYDAQIGEKAASQKVQTMRHTEELEMLRYSLKGLSLFSGVIFVLGTGMDYLGSHWFLESPTVSLSRPVALFALTTIAVAKYADWIFRSAGKAGVKLRVNMHTLISVSTIIGLALALFHMVRQTAKSDAMYYDSVIGVLLIITVGRYLDLLSRRRASDAFAGLYSLLDQTSSVKLCNIDKRVPSSILRSGDEFLIEPFSVVPCDSYVVDGVSHVNEAVITGEALPKTKAAGDLLLAGSRNGPNQLRAMVNQDYEGSFLLQLVRSVEGSLSSKVSAQHRIDIITQYFVSIIFAIAVAAATFFFFSSLGEGFDRAHALDAAGRKMMTILAAACPCALGLATPCAVMAGIDVAWQKGILMLEGGETMELLDNITQIVMDKTGTLTRGTLTVSDMAINGHWKDHQNQLAVLICAAEEQGMSAHPLALAIFRRLLPLCKDMWKHYQMVGGVKDLAETGGRGVRCDVNIGDGQWRTVCIGNIEYMRENEVKGVKMVSLQSETKGSLVFAGIDGAIAASMDVIRPDAKTTIEALKDRGLGVRMLTGDNATEACRISQLLDIPVMASCATPDVKLNHVKSLQDEGHQVIMIGDGMNDGPSLATSDVGIMMAHGRKCLSSGGSVLLLQPRLQSLLTLLDISHTTMRQISANIAWAIAYNIIAVSLAVGLGSPFNISINPPIAAAMMSISSLFITIQGLLLRMRLMKRHCGTD